MIIQGILGRVEPGNPASPESPPGDAAGRIAGNGRTQAFSAPGLTGVAIEGGALTDGTLTCAIAGNVDWLDYELADIQVKRGAVRALAQAYRNHGPGMLEHIGGRFVAFVWDAGRRSGLLAGDRFGQMPVYWTRRPDGTLLFGPTASTVIHLTGETARLSDQGIYNYLYFHMVPGPDTVFRDVNKLMAAQVLTFDADGCNVSRYWNPDFREDADGPFDEAGEEMLGLLSSSVARFAQGADAGAFLSGGLDSSTVAGLLARHRPRPKTYSIGFDAEGYDEIAYAKLASEHFDTDFRSYYVTPDDVVEALPLIAAAYDEPFGNSSALPAYFCARFAAEDGRQRLLAGDGGDELFAGNERYAKQAVFERYGMLPSWGRQHLLEPLLHVLPDRSRLVSKGRSYVQQAKVPLPDRLQTYNFLNRLDARGIVSDALWQAIDPQQPLLLDRDLYHQPSNASTLNRMLYLDWQHTLTDNDLRKVNRMCQLAGIEVEYPMLDDRLVEFSTRVSSARKMRGNRLRDFYKRAVAGFLPQKIIHKSKHGFGLPFGIWMAEHPGLEELALDNLARMKQRQFISTEFLENVIRLHREQHAGYYGEFIWVLMMLELWLTAQGIEP